jgi:hypothetical protein
MDLTAEEGARMVLSAESAEFYADRVPRTEEKQILYAFLMRAHKN